MTELRSVLWKQPGGSGEPGYGVIRTAPATCRTSTTPMPDKA